MRIMHFDGARAVALTLGDGLKPVRVETTRIVPGLPVYVDDCGDFPCLTTSGRPFGSSPNVIAAEDPAEVGTTLARDIGAHSFGDRKDFDAACDRVMSAWERPVLSREEHAALLADPNLRDLLQTPVETLDDFGAWVVQVRHAKAKARDLSDLRSAIDALGVADLLAKVDDLSTEVDGMDETFGRAVLEAERKSPDAKWLLASVVELAVLRIANSTHPPDTIAHRDAMVEAAEGMASPKGDAVASMGR